ncbi:DUF3995 domain-containing protein [Verminephrobacter eiseniae]|uniref:DUF3995 domain-containing protein n=1 Tax=Verminephrobacter eiseniae TaxID=364317 RepID=UPI002237DE0C|nr:DUF3995 domain-containing protein [Verminephrobacter eiseniae]MCW5261107.1 DUF3995 domain-containing protein [Verminephrobacter eiseniae]
MKLTAGFIAGATLVPLALIHFYWAFGGAWGKDSAIPSDRKGVKLFQPGLPACLLTGLLLLLCAVNIFMGAGIMPMLFVSPPTVTLGLWATTLIFVLRAIGDFKYIGFFKSINDTEFGRRDSLFFSPLCLFLAILCLAMAMA